MARVLGVLRLLVLLSKRDLQSLSSCGLNNLFLCAAFLAVSGTTPRTAFWSAFPFLFVLAVPLLFAVSADALKRIPAERSKLWPLNRTESALLRILGITMTPAFWVGGAILLAWAGAAACLAFVMLAIAIQILVALHSYGLSRHSSPQLLRYIPRLPGPLGGITQVAIRQILTTLDFYTALILSLAGNLYRCLSAHPNPDAFPIIALMVALSLSTYAQRTFGLDGRAGLVRYHLLPRSGWQILLAKDAALLAVITLLVLPINLRVGLTCSLAVIAIGRWPSLRQFVVQRRWRFTGGDIRFCVAQVIVGGILGVSAFRVSLWFLVLAGALYAASLFAGDRWWYASVS